MTFTFDTTIPAANNNPSVDQAGMLTNNVSTDGILAVDHISFNTANGGQHKQVTFNNKNVPGAQTDPQSVLYTNSGTASTVAQVFFRNQNRIFQVTTLKAWGLVDSTGAIINSQSFNVDSVTKNSTGNFTANLTSGSVSSAKVAVMISFESPVANPGTVASISKYVLTGLGQVTILFFTTLGTAVDPTSFSFSIIQI